MKRLRLKVLLCLGLLAAAPPGARSADAPPAPATGIWISYGGESYFDRRQPSPDGRSASVSHGDGIVTPLAIRLDDTGAGAAWRGVVRLPGNVKSGFMPPAARNWQHFSGGFDRDPDEAIHLWRSLLGRPSLLRAARPGRCRTRRWTATNPARAASSLRPMTGRSPQIRDGPNSCAGGNGRMRRAIVHP